MAVDWVVVGIDNGGTTNNGTILDSSGRFLLDRMAEVPSDVREGPDKAIRALVQSVEQVLGLAGVPLSTVRAVGLDTPGPASADGVISSKGSTNFAHDGWRGFDFRFTNFPPRWTTLALATAIYVNFFAHHWLPDIRWGLFAATAVLFWRTKVWFQPVSRYRSMPLLVGFFLVAIFIWFAENIGTFAHAWSYPNQMHGWQLVPPSKLGSWYLLMIISFVLVSLVSQVREPDLVSRSDKRSAARPTPARQAP